MKLKNSINLVAVLTVLGMAGQTFAAPKAIQTIEAAKPEARPGEVDPNALMKSIETNPVFRNRGAEVGTAMNEILKDAKLRGQPVTTDIWLKAVVTAYSQVFGTKNLADVTKVMDTVKSSLNVKASKALDTTSSAKGLERSTFDLTETCSIQDGSKASRTVPGADFAAIEAAARKNANGRDVLNVELAQAAAEAAVDQVDAGKQRIVANGQLTSALDQFSTDAQGFLSTGELANARKAALAMMEDGVANPTAVVEGYKILLGDLHTGLLALKNSKDANDVELARNAQVCAGGLNSCDQQKYSAFKAKVRTGYNEHLTKFLGKEGADDFNKNCGRMLPVAA